MLEHTCDTIKSYGLSVYGFGGNMSWKPAQWDAKAAQIAQTNNTDASKLQSTASDLNTLRPGAELQSLEIGRPDVSDTVKGTPGEYDGLVPEAGLEPHGEAARSAAAPAKPDTQAVGSSNISDMAGNPGEGNHDLSAQSLEFSATGSVPTALQTQYTQSAGETDLTDLWAFAEFHSLQHSTAVWPQSTTFGMEAFGSSDIVTVAGDYYDIQISLDFGSLNTPAVSAGGAQISFGSVLHSGPSAYDLIVIDQDLVEVNAILQHNIGAVAMSGADFGVQSNQAAIMDYAVHGGAQMTLGEVVSIAYIQQANYVSGIASAVQINHATIFDVEFGATPLHGPPATVNRNQADHKDAAMAVGAELNYSMLHVTGTYYEINLIVQVSALATQNGGNAQFNDAVIYDFEDVAVNQYVGGDEFELNAISQLNYLSQIDQLIPFSLGSFFPNFEATPSETATGNGAAAIGLAGTTMASPHRADAMSGDAMGDLIVF